MSDGKGPQSLADAVQSARAGGIDFRGPLGAFVAAQVLDPSGAALQDGRGESQPVIHPVGAVSYKAVFSVLERASSLGDPAPCVTTMSGLDVLRRARPGTGIVMDAGCPGGPPRSTPELSRRE